MPSGYTEPVLTGKITEFRDFALDCSRAFGARVMERDNGMDAQWEPRTIDEYYITRLNESIQKLNELTARTPEQWTTAHVKACEERFAYLQDTLAKAETAKARYSKMLVFAEDYVAPSADHENFKQFMVEQLVESMKFDVYKPHVSDTDVDRLTVEQFRDQKIAQVRKDISYYAKEIEEDADRVIGSNNWMYQLFTSLEEK